MDVIPVKVQRKPVKISKPMAVVIYPEEYNHFAQLNL